MKMNHFKKLLGAGTGAVVAISAALLVSFTGNASAIACYQYDANGFQTSQTPVFNNICGITSPLSSTQGNYPLGDERDFVRIRPNTSNSPLGQNNPPLVNSLGSACNDGDKFDIWTYVHNDAESQFNDNGNGSAVAHNVRLATSASTNTTAKAFSFGGTVSASNAASVSDTAMLECGDQVTLSLVPSSVHYNNDLSQTTYGNLPDSAVNGSTPLGNPVWQSGNVWGCWDYRVVVVYQVVVHKPAPPPPATPTYMCNALDLAADVDRTVKLSALSVTATNGATFSKAVVDWGDNSAPLTTDNVAGQTHQYAQDGTYTVTATAHFTVNGQDVTAGGPKCVRNVTFAGHVPPKVTPRPPTTTTPTTTTPSTLVNTGPGSIAGLFAATSAIGAVAHRWMLGRRLSRQ